MFYVTLWAGVVLEVGHPQGVAVAPVAEQLLPERRVAFAQRPVDHDQRLQSNLPSFFS